MMRFGVFTGDRLETYIVVLVVVSKVSVVIIDDGMNILLLEHGSGIPGVLWQSDITK
jgi:hypothetical protein